MHLVHCKAELWVKVFQGTYRTDTHIDTLRHGRIGAVQGSSAMVRGGRS